MATTKEDNKGFSVLKDHVYSLSVAGKQADRYTKTTKAIAEYVGRVYSHEMKQLVLNGTESVPVEPDYPEGDTPSDRDKSVWSKRYDHFLREETKYNDHKAKVFTIVYGQCEKAMKNQIESQAAFASVESNMNVAGLLRLIKDVAFDSNDKKYPPMQAAWALKRLVTARQHEKEDLVDYYKRFQGLMEMVERAYGDLAPAVLAEKDQAYKRDAEGVTMAERNKMLAYMFLDGADKTMFGYLVKNMGNDYALGNDTYPEDVESALQVLLLYQEGVHRKSTKKKIIQRDNDEMVELSFAQLTKNQLRKRGMCFTCGKKGHTAPQCPHRGEPGMKMITMVDETQNLQTAVGGSWMG